MPAKNSIKQYVEKGYYHLYNRGVEKRTIFEDEQDYGVFLGYLKEYLIEKDEEALREKLADKSISGKEKDRISKVLQLNNFAGEITLLAYCLMPNHFHFLVKQNEAGSIDKFINSLGTRYTMYFNRKYERVGRLYQDVYKAVLVTTEEQWLYLSKYIHKQALAFQGVALESQPSSYPEYLGVRNSAWVQSREILAYFSKTKSDFSYKDFVEGNSEVESIKELLIEDN